ncbi:MAG: TrmH family RNA methyltransferase, partial [Candidatus Saccharimonadales bacterium]
MSEIIVIAHNIRSIHNVGSIFRTSEGFGVSKLILSGYTPYPTIPNDTRLPHLSAALSKKINKTALGAEVIVPFEYTLVPPFQALRANGFVIVGLEQDASSVPISRY